MHLLVNEGLWEYSNLINKPQRQVEVNIRNYGKIGALTLNWLTRFMKPGTNIMIVEGTSKPYYSISYINEWRYGGRAKLKARATLPARPDGLWNDVVS